MPSPLFSLLVCTSAWLLASAAASPPAPSAHNLPIIFFHGITGNASNGANFKANLTTDARPFLALNFCENACSFRDLNAQVQLAIKQIREYTTSDARFDQGYVFLAHSQGAAIARAVIEEMDDHKVHTFISLAGAVNGVFYGPQTSDLVPALVWLKSIAPLALNTSVFNYTAFSTADVLSGKLQVALTKLQMDRPELQSSGSSYQLSRSPYQAAWLTYNTFFAVINNLREPTNKASLAEQVRRKRNFLRLNEVHFFASPHDEVVAPWQTSHLAQYSTVASLEQLEADFRALAIVPMRETVEYTQDTYGLRSLDARGALHLHTLENVPHIAWVADTVSLRDGSPVAFRRVYERSVYPLLQPETTPTPTKPSCH